MREVAQFYCARNNPEGCRERFPKLTLIDLVKMVGSMDLFEHHTLSILCGNDRRERIVPDASRFGQRVWKAIDAYELGHLFERVARFDGKPEDSHYRMRPRGFDWSGSWSPLPAVLDQWRKDYRKLEVGRQMMAMSVLHLYNETPDKRWTNRVPRSWHVGEGVRLLKSEGALADWGALMGLYSGW